MYIWNFLPVNDGVKDMKVKQPAEVEVMWKISETGVKPPRKQRSCCSNFP